MSTTGRFVSAAAQPLERARTISRQTVRTGDEGETRYMSGCTPLNGCAGLNTGYLGHQSKNVSGRYRRANTHQSLAPLLLNAPIQRTPGPYACRLFFSAHPLLVPICDKTALLRASPKKFRPTPLEANRVGLLIAYACMYK